MTAIAGVVSARPLSDREALTRKLLMEQSQYGSASSQFARTSSAAFGSSPWRDATAAIAVSDRELMLVADLRLDNRGELLERLGADGRRASDAELLLSLWVKAGEECLSWIAGDFALAIFDQRTGFLTLARDPTGQMPLHYASTGGEFAFASMPTGLRAFLGSLTINRLALAASACDARDDDPSSHFEHISRVLPGEVVRLSPTGIRRRVYWAPPTFYDGVGGGAELVEEYRHLLDLAVGDRLKDCAAHPVATHLSSGYDSSSVTATAARLLPSPDRVLAYTSAPSISVPMPSGTWRFADESEIAAATAATLGIRHFVIRETPPMRTVIRRQSLLFQEPFISVPNIAWLLQIRREAAAAGANCLLSGDCGNYSLNAGGLYVLSEWVRRGRWFTWSRQAWRAAARPDTRWRGVLFNSFRPWMANSVSEMLRIRFQGAGPSDPVSFLRPEWRMKALREAPEPPRFANGYDERVHWIRNSSLGMIRKGGLAGEGVDERDPLADRRLIEFSLRIPPEQLYWNGVSRPMARAALADRLSKSVIDLKVRGLQAADWAVRFTQSDARDLLDEILASSTANELLDLERMRQAIDRWPTENWNTQSAHRVYRQSLIGALSGGMFALVHEQGASAKSEML